MQPVGKWRLEEPVQEAPIKPVGKWSIAEEEAPVEVDTRDTDTFAALEDPNEVYEEIETAPTTEGAVSDLLRPELVQAEGEVLKVYQGKKDEAGVLTAGIGHKLTAAELKKFSEGDDITSEQVQAWYEADSKKAVNASVKQAEELGVKSEEFMTALASVNFQLGTNWKRVHKQTWKLMKAGRFEEAAEEAAASTWNDQTPERVKAFQEALRKEAGTQQYTKLKDGWYKDPDTGERFQVAGGERL